MNIIKLQNTILSWYEENGRNLPWRNESDPYLIWVAETMSQQTQIQRVVPKYQQWCVILPTLQSLAQVDRHTLLSLRSGLGYNNRAIRLQKSAQIIIEKFSGRIPSNEKDLLSLPGIGPYTAHAILAFAFNQEVPVLDINIRRVLITMLELPHTISDSQLRDIAIVCIPPGKSAKRHHAMMDYGALVLTAHKTGIKSSRQSTFIGSARWVRGSIIKDLVKKKTISISNAMKEYPHSDFSKIINKMHSEGIITIQGEYIMISML